MVRKFPFLLPHQRVKNFQNCTCAVSGFRLLPVGNLCVYFFTLTGLFWAKPTPSSVVLSGHLRTTDGRNDAIAENQQNRPNFIFCHQ